MRSKAQVDNASASRRSRGAEAAADGAQTRGGGWLAAGCEDAADVAADVVGRGGVGAVVSSGALDGSACERTSAERVTGGCSRGAGLGEHADVVSNRPTVAAKVDTQLVRSLIKRPWRVV